MVKKTVYFFSFSLDENSAADYFISLCNELAKVHTVIIIANKVRNTNVPLSEKIKVFKWPSNNPRKIRDFYFLIKLVLNYKPSFMVSIFSSVNIFLIVGWLFHVKNRIAWIRSLSTQFHYNKFLVFRKSIILRLATRVFVNSTATLEDASQFYQIDKQKMSIIYNSVMDYNLVVDNNISYLPNKILYVGRLHHSKGIDILIKAIAILRSEKLELEIIGAGSYKSELKNLVKNLNLEDKVNFVGHKKKSEVLIYFKKAFCTVVPSFSEAFGYTIIEAMSMKSCVVGANNTGIKETIIHNKTGLLFETGNPTDLAEKMLYLLRNNAVRDNLAKEGYLRFLSKYEINTRLLEDVQFYQ
ncbi:glycosyltransferase family 4 protein [Aegicerativicinus sediminis]|uniref:glycosyltransferase family 4 protein n=1 Tax=Aegicerativicinus sediminis TaxID=2893202 RepID=UPI001E3691CB|nr:glycosyltransferase family 4 protein [Aegicerativicinus sediminis]